MRGARSRKEGAVAAFTFQPFSCRRSSSPVCWWGCGFGTCCEDRVRAKGSIPLTAVLARKCFMMVVFQNKIIYMPGLPPNSRRERIANWASKCGGVQWTEERAVAEDGIELALAVATVPLPNGGRPAVAAVKNQPAPAHVYVLYFQGRLPFKTCVHPWNLGTDGVS